MSASNTNLESLYDLIAKTGDNITSLGTLTGFGDSPSINDDLGLIAFIGQSNGLTDLLVENGSGHIINLSVAYPDLYSKAVQINNQNQVVAKYSLGGALAIRVYELNNINSSQVIATGAFPADFYDFESLFPFPSLNNNGQSVFLATPKEQFPNIALETLSGTNLFGNRTYNERRLATGNARPMIADNGQIVVRDPLSSITLYNYELNAVESIANNASGFTYVGLSPGISDDGKIVTFYGELSDAGAEALGLTPGNGIFASIDMGSGTRRITRIAGIAGNGYLDPGEVHDDANNNGRVDVGEDKGLITSFAKDERVGVSYRSVGDNNFGTVAYLAFNDGNESLFSNQFEMSSSNSTITHRQSNIVAKVGAQANIVSPDLTGVIQDLNIYDPVNSKGQVAFWLKTSTSQEAIVRANPVLKPILLVPGILGSFPRNNDYAGWLRNRGVHPNSLQLEQIGRLYDDLIETLKRAGYVEGVNLFVATNDWRLNPGPIDGSIDGRIDRTVEELTDDTYEYSVDQLAFWLKKAVKGWRSQFPNLPAADIPELDSVDIIGHSAEGYPVRAYIQSDAYGQSFQLDDGSTRQLPKVNNFISLGVPHRGATGAWNLLQNDFDGGGHFTKFLAQILRVAYSKVQNGETIALSGNPNVEGAITPSELEELSPTEFIERYVPTLRSLLATYPFMDILADNPNESLKTAEFFNPNQANKFLLDPNNGYDSQPNVDPTLFTEKINKLTVVSGTGIPARDKVIQRDQPSYFLGESYGTVFPFNNDIFSLNVVLRPGEIWYEEKKGELGDADGTVPLLSAQGMFEQYPKANVERQAFPGLGHSQFPFDINVQKLILKTLGVDLKEELISTNLNQFSRIPPLDLSYATPFSNTLIFDPIEGFLVDGSGRRLGYTEATGAVTEIPNSAWLGDKDGFGFFNGSVEGPFKLQLIGTGQEYYISALLQTEDGPGGIEARGFLAAGEQLTLDVPVNNAPLIDLNGLTEGIDFSTTFGTSGVTVMIVDPSGVLADSDSPNLRGATITLTNPQDGALESLNATPVGNIAVAYNPTISTLTLSGSDTIANYQQVLRTVTYTNTATTPNPLEREITFVVNDGAGFNSLSPTATTTLTFPEPPSGEIIEGTRGQDTLVGSDGDDIITGFQDPDTLTGNGGNDQFVYNRLADRRDIITDFEVGSDKIVLTNLLNSIGYSGSNPLGDGIVQIISRRGSSLVQIDSDGLGTAKAKALILVENVAVDDLNNVNNFVF